MVSQSKRRRQRRTSLAELQVSVDSEYHEKRRKNVYSLSWPDQSLSRDDFETVREICEAGAAWYARAYREAGLPGRFLFLTRQAADETADMLKRATAPAPVAVTADDDLADVPF